jgi:hypothetical protein
MPTASPFYEQERLHRAIRTRVDPDRALLLAAVKALESRKI